MFSRQPCVNYLHVQSSMILVVRTHWNSATHLVNRIKMIFKKLGTYGLGEIPL